MRNIKTLRDIGKDRNCLIIGGGHSVNNLELSAIPRNMYVIVTNNHMLPHANMIVYYDKDMRDYFNKTKIMPNQLLVGFKHSDKIDHTSNNCTHYFNYESMVFGDSGFHALQFADQVFGFNNIYLSGYDYSVKGDSYHYNEDKSNKTKQDRFITWSIGKVLNQYNDIEWKNNIFNCNRNSALDIFKYGLPY